MPATLNLKSIVVHESRDGGFGDNSEWRLDIDVAGAIDKHLDFDKDGINSSGDNSKDDQEFPLDMEVGPLNRNDFLNTTIGANGHEDDGLSPNDPLPTAFKALTASEYHDGGFSMHAERGDFAYTLNWTVEVA